MIHILWRRVIRRALTAKEDSLSFLVDGIKSLSREERGDMLPFALVALAIGVLLIAPLLAHVSSSHRTVDASRVIMGRHYASDAGTEWGIHRLSTDETLRQVLIASMGTPQTMSVALPVNNQSPTVQVVAVSTWMGGEGDDQGNLHGTVSLDWLIWANSSSRSRTIELSGSGHTVLGNVHSNNQIRLQGSSHAISGRVRHVGSYTAEGSDHDVPGPFEEIDESLSLPAYWDIADFRPGGVLAEAAADTGQYFEHHGLHIEGSGTVIPPGIYYCTGAVHVAGSGVIGHNVTIVSELGIHISGSGIEFTPYTSGLTFLSNANDYASGAIRMTGSGQTGGAAYAPRGMIALAGSGGVIQGALIGDEIDISSNGWTIQPVPNLRVPAPPKEGGEGEGGGSGGGYDCQPTSFDWAIWMTDTVRFEGNQPLIHGGIHSGDQIIVSSPNFVAHGPMESRNGITFNRTQPVVKAGLFSHGDIGIDGWAADVQGPVRTSGGAVTLSADSVVVNGSVHAAGDVRLSGSNTRIQGPVHTQGRVRLNSNQARIIGDVYADGDIELTTTECWIQGNVYNGGDIAISAGRISQIANIYGHVYSTGDLTLSGWNAVIQGDVHINGTLRLTGSSTRIYGNVYVGGDVVLSGWNAQIHGDVYVAGSVLPANKVQGQIIQGTHTPYTFSDPGIDLTVNLDDQWPVRWSMADFRPGGAYAGIAQGEDLYHVHTSPWNLGWQDTVDPGLYYLEQSLHVSGGEVSGEQATIVAEGVIHMNGNIPSFPSVYPATLGLSFFSHSTSDTAIHMACNQLASGQQSGGMIVAERGGILMSGNQPAIVGALVGRTLRVTSNEITVGPAPAICLPGTGGGGGSGGGGDTYGIFDVRSEAEGTVITARLKELPDGKMEILSWFVE